MSGPFVGEIRMFAGNFAPAGWSFCNGALVPIDQNPTLFNLIGTTYGGDGQSNFRLPDLRGRIPLHAGASHILAEVEGVEQVTLTSQQMPGHTHTLVGSSDAPSPALGPQGSVPANTSSSGPLYDPSGNLALKVAMSPSAITTTGGNQPHNNLAPYLCVTFIISLFGIFPSQS